MNNMEVVAWRIRGYADDWLLLYSEEQAKNEATNGNLIQPLVTLTSAQVEIGRLTKERDVLLEAIGKVGLDREQQKWFAERVNRNLPTDSNDAP